MKNLLQKGAVSLAALGLITSVSFAVVGGLITMITYVNNKAEANSTDVYNLSKETTANTTNISNLVDSNKRIEEKVDTLLLDRGYSPDRVIKSAITNQTTTGPQVTSQ